MGVISEIALEQEEREARGMVDEKLLAEQAEQQDDARQQAEADEAQKILQKMQAEAKAKTDASAEEEKRSEKRSGRQNSRKRRQICKRNGSGLSPWMMTSCWRFQSSGLVTQPSV